MPPKPSPARIEAADSRDWQVLIGSTENDRVRELPMIKSLGGQVDTLVGYLSHSDAELGPYVNGVPVVVVDRDQRPSVYATVRVDVKAGVRRAVDHLVARGHRRIGMIDCPSICDPVVRRQTFLELAEEHGLPVDHGWIATGEQSVAGGEAAFDVLRTAHPDLTAVFAFNDVVAFGALQSARRQGVRVPDDCALVGFDGLSMGELLDPPLTTVHIDKRRLGELAVRQVGEMLAGRATTPAVLTPNLVVRGSA